MYDGQTYVVMFVTQYKERQAIPNCALRGKGCTLFFVAHAGQKIHCLAPKFGAIVLPKILWADFILRPSDECVRLSALRIAAKKREHLLSLLILNIINLIQFVNAVFFVSII